MPKFDVDDALVRKLAALLTDTGLTEIEYEVGEQRIRVSRGGGTTVVARRTRRSRSRAGDGSRARRGARSRPPAGAVTSPMVGTAYAATEPGATPLREGRRQGFQGPDPADHRGHEGDEPDSRTPWRHGAEYPLRRRPPGRIRRSPAGRRLGAWAERAAGMFEKILIANRGEIALRIHPRLPRDGHPHGGRAFRQPTPTPCTCGSPTRACASARRRSRQSYLNIPRSSCRPPTIAGADAIHPGMDSCPRTPSSPAMVEEHGFAFIGPTPEHHPHHGRQGAGQATPRSRWAYRSCPARTAPSATTPRPQTIADDDRLSRARSRRRPAAAAQRHEGGQRRGEIGAGPESPGAARPRPAFGNDAVYLEKYLSHPPPHRDPDPRRRPAAMSIASGRARLLAAAPSPEGAGGSALARPQCRAARA